MPISLIVGNWKMNATPAEAAALASQIAALVPTAAPSRAPNLSMCATGWPPAAPADAPDANPVRAVICPPFISIPAAASALRAANAPYIAVGAQNLHHEPAGAFTGEVSAPMLAGICQYAIIGHSERRTLFAETDADINLKLKAALNAAITPILCVGETLAQRQAGHAAQTTQTQLQAALQGVPNIAPLNAADAPDSADSAAPDAADAPDSALAPIAAHNRPQIAVAYEPVWAIGSGQSADPAIAQTTMSGIRETLAALYGAEAAAQIPLLYGGSVNPQNIAAYIQQPDINGALVGGASLTPQSFCAIIAAATAAQTTPSPQSP